MESCARVIETELRTRQKRFRVRLTSTRSTCGLRGTYSKQGIASGYIYRAVISRDSTGTSIQASRSQPRRTQKSLIKLFITEQTILQRWCCQSSRVTEGSQLCLKPPKSFSDTVSTGSGSDLVNRGNSRIVGKSRILISDQVAIAPCTDCVQARRPTF